MLVGSIDIGLVTTCRSSKKPLLSSPYSRRKNVTSGFWMRLINVQCCCYKRLTFKIARGLCDCHGSPSHSQYWQVNKLNSVQCMQPQTSLLIRNVMLNETKTQEPAVTCIRTDSSSWQMMRSKYREALKNDSPP